MKLENDERWSIDEDQQCSNAITITDDEGVEICIMTAEDDVITEWHRERAAVIALAPEMLAALRTLAGKTWLPSLTKVLIEDLISKVRD